MSLDNSTIQQPLPGDLSARVENALNLITSLEAEETRLKKLISGYIQKINELHEESKTVEGTIKRLKEEIPDLEKAVQISKEILNELELNKSNIEDHLSESANRLQILDDEISDKTIAISKRESLLVLAEKDINDRISDLDKKEKSHQRKVEKLHEALK